MQGPCAALLLSAGELGAVHRDSVTWYRREGGPVCSWPRKPQPPRSRTSSPVRWTWARHSEFPPPGTLPWPRPASTLRGGAHAGGKHPDGSPASARSLGHTFETLAHGTPPRGAAELRPLGPRHTRTSDDAPPQDGEACCRLPILARTERLGVEEMGVGRRTIEGWRSR